MNNFQWIWQYLRSYKFRIVIALIFVVVNSLLIIINPILTGELVDRVINKGQTDLLIPFLAIMIGVQFIRTVIRYSYQIMFALSGWTQRSKAYTVSGSKHCKFMGSP